MGEEDDVTASITLYAHWSSNGTGSDKTDGDKEGSDQKNKISIKASKTSIKKSTVKKKDVTIQITVTGNIGKATFENISSSKLKKYITVTKDGKVTFKKGAPKGTYKIKVTVAASDGQAGTGKTLKIKVK